MSANPKRGLLSRRNFLIHGGWAAALAIFVYQVGRFLGAPPLDAGPAPVVDAGAPDLYEQQKPVYVPEARAWLRRDGATLQALDAVCPHLGCIVRQDGEAQGFYCPCHGSRFAPDGTVLQGPAQSNLRALRVDVQDEQVLLRLD